MSELIEFVTPEDQLAREIGISRTAARGFRKEMLTAGVDWQLIRHPIHLRECVMLSATGARKMREKCGVAGSPGASEAARGLESENGAPSLGGQPATLAGSDFEGGEKADAAPTETLPLMGVTRTYEANTGEAARPEDASASPFSVGPVTAQSRPAAPSPTIQARVTQCSWVNVRLIEVEFRPEGSETPSRVRVRVKDARKFRPGMLVPIESTRGQWVLACAAPRWVGKF